MDPLKHARRVIILVIGATVVLAGVALLVLPGPAFIVIPAGLAILSTEFVWAARLLKRMKENAEYAAHSVMSAASSKNGDTPWQRFKNWCVPKRVSPDPHSQ